MKSLSPLEPSESWLTCGARSDAYKLCVSFQRPNPNECESIGSWSEIFLAISFFAVSSSLATRGMLSAGRVGP